MLRPVIALVPALLLAATTAAAQEHAHAHREHAGGRLGTVAFPNSGAAAAQPAFLRGIALLHSFSYTDAAEAFREAQRADPAFALAYWGEALTYTHPLWGEEDVTASRAVLARLGATAAERLAKAPTERERGFGAAVEALYADTDRQTRITGFVEGMRTLAARHPDDLELSAFAAIAVLAGSGYRGDDRGAVVAEAAALAQKVFEANPDHPGAAHYLIHAYDDPSLAKNGVAAARAYAQIAPDAEHALHMPSHIFVQLGLWDDAATSNERAWAASRAWAAAKRQPATELDFHALAWLQYAYLQQGRHAAARALIDTARAVLAGADVGGPGGVDALYAVPAMEFMQAMETGAWDASAAVTLPQAGPPANVRAQFFGTLAVYRAAAAAAMRGDAAAAEAAAQRLRANAGGAYTGPIAGLAASLDALALRARGDREGALAKLAEASRMEQAVPPTGPPAHIPSDELLGALLLDAGNAAEAAAAYERALALRPNRPAALLGLARARAAAGDRAAAADAYRRLLAAWHAADPAL
ncbi:MAG TPA: hypothetical protein VFQ45_19230, partial [Longimicrobium sp.]|nr:hypothetical protein [Longimicrobium sp.]